MTFVAHLRKLVGTTTEKKVYLFSVVIGVLSGFSALGFSYLLAFVEDISFHQFANIDLGYAQGEFSLTRERITDNNHAVYVPIFFFMLPIIGLFLSGLLVQLFDKKSGGAGTDALIHSFHEEEGKIKFRTPFVKAFATIATLAGAGSAGKEGPIAHIGSGIGSICAKILGCGPRAGRSLFIAGMAGALGAIFRAPLGAAIIAVEVLYKEDFESDSLVPAIISSITGYFVFTTFRGFHTVFQIKESMFRNWEELFFYIILGIACSLFGYIFVKTYTAVHALFSRLELPTSIRGLLGGLVVAIIGIFSEQSIGSGFGFLQELMREENLHSISILGGYFFSPENIKNVHAIIAYLFIIIFLKIIATSFTIGSGASGGVFGPSIFIGGTLGAAIGLVSQYFFPKIVLSPVPYLVVGMAGFFAGVANAPIGSVIMVCELTGSYQLLAPLLVVAILSIIFSSRFSIYTGQKDNKFHSPAHSWDMNSDILDEIQVKQEYKRINKNNQQDGNDHSTILLDVNFPTNQVFKLSQKVREYDFILVDQKRNYVGIFSLNNITKTKARKIEKNKEPILSYASTTEDPLKLSDSLSLALNFFLSVNMNRAPVINEQNKVVGYLSVQDIFLAYKKKIKKIKS